MFATFRPAVERALLARRIVPTTNFPAFVRDELSALPPDLKRLPPAKRHLAKLYELRSRYLDWELGTGYLGCFSKNAGTRYAFTRIVETVSHLCAPLTFGSRILEIGCGAGLLCLELAKAAKMVVGIDISHFVLDFARTVQEYLQYQNVSFQVGDAENLMFRDETFDLIVCSEVLEHLLAPEKALAEIRRVLKADGSVILSTPCAASLSDMTMGIFRIFNKQLEAEKNVHFDKKTYFAVKRSARQHRFGFAQLPDTSETPEDLQTEAFMRVHERFRYQALVTMFRNADFEVEQAIGTIFAFPPHYQVFYRYVPAVLLPLVRLMENGGNRLHLFQRFGSVTTCFRLKPAKLRNYRDCT